MGECGGGERRGGLLGVYIHDSDADAATYGGDEL